MTNKTELTILDDTSKFNGVKLLLWNFGIDDEASLLTYQYEVLSIPDGVEYTKYSLENIEEPATLEFQQTIGNIILSALENEMLNRGLDMDLLDRE